MGLIHVTVAVRSVLSPDGQAYESNFLVDIGSTDSLAPAPELQKIGVAREGNAVYELNDGTKEQFAYGFVRIDFLGEKTVGRVIFGPEGAEPVLGVTALESVGITIDSVTHRLKRLPAIPLK